MVELRSRSRLIWWSLARLTAATVASRADFDVEEIEDLRLAVDELCLSLVQAERRAAVFASLHRQDGAIEIECTLRASRPASTGHPVTTGRTASPSGSSTPWSTSMAETSADGRPCAWLRKRRAPSTTVADDRTAPPRRETREKFVEFATTRDPALRDQLVTAHLGLAHQLARRFANRGEPYDDLVQVASMALIKSVDRFDPERGVEFSTFATRTMIGELKRHFRDKGWAVRAPRRVQELYLELGPGDRARSPRSSAARRRWPSWPTTTGASEEAVLEALEAGRAYRSASIDAPDRQDETLADRIGTEDAKFSIVDDRDVLAPALAKLAPREQAILQLRFFDGLTQSEIAARIGVSQMHVSRLLAASLGRLRKSLDEDP